MKKFICLIMLIAIVLCCFAGCGSDATSAAEVEGQPIDATSGIVTDYSGCWITRTDGKVVRGTVISWMIVNENLIQVTMTNVKVIGDSGSSVDKVRTYLVSADRVYFYTD